MTEQTEKPKLERELARALEDSRGTATSRGRFWFTGNTNEIAAEVAKALRGER